MKISDKGLSLTELLTALGLSVLTLALTLTIFITTQQFYVTNVLAQNLQRDADLALTKITKGGREPEGIHRLSEAKSYTVQSLSELHFVGMDDTERWYTLSADGKSILYYHPTSDGNPYDTIYSAPSNASLTLRFYVPSGAEYANINVGIDVGIVEIIKNKTVSGSASTMVLLRNHEA